MKIRNLLIALGTAAVLGSLNLTAADALMSPRATGNEIKHIATTDNAVSVKLNAAVSPRLAGNASKTAAAASNGTATTCNKMDGSPKMIAECASHPGAPMACCTVVVDTK
ncbi:MAG TPA: hypothetical protein VFV23_08080 [Verrucomicrobiae bacterium]|nr:hypothetical protein [Verrucomicrobiae bacterium]